MSLKSTYTYALLAVSPAAYEEVRRRLVDAAPEDHRDEAKPEFALKNEPINMHGLALIADIEPKEEQKKPKKSKKQRRLLKSEEWALSVSKGQGAIAAIRRALETLQPEFDVLSAAISDLNERKDDYSERLSNIPENLSQGEHAERLRAIDELDMPYSEDAEVKVVLEAELEKLSDALDECENADLPKD